MAACVSLAQLIITIVMSILRGSLRMQRLTRESNAVHHEADIFAKHELDWLAIELALKRDSGLCKEKTCKVHLGETEINWRVIGIYEGSTPVPSMNRNSPQEEPCAIIKAAFRRRLRLAHLTGHMSHLTSKDGSVPQWVDAHVRVREKAKQVATALSSMATHLFPHPKATDRHSLWLKVQARRTEKSVDSEDAINVDLSPLLSDNSRTRWHVDSATIEAILGLWLWSSDTGSSSRDHGSSETDPLSDGLSMYRIVSSDIQNRGTHLDFDMQADMDLWMGEHKVNLLQGQITLENPNSGGPDIHLSKKLNKGANGHIAEFSTSDTPKIFRFCGWANLLTPPQVDSDEHTPSVQESNASLDREQSRTNDMVDPPGQIADVDSVPVKDQNVQIGSEPTTVFVQYADLTNSGFTIVDIYAQELLTMLLLPMVNLAIDKGYKVRDIPNILAGFPILQQHKLVTACVDAFVDSGLGSSPDAMLCIVPTLRPRLRTLGPAKILESVVDTVKWHRQKEEWEMAETILREACGRFALSTSIFVGDLTCGAMILRAACEFYRWSLADYYNEKRRNFGKSGIEWVLGNFPRELETHPSTREILDCYEESLEMTCTILGNATIRSTFFSMQYSLKMCIKNNSRSSALHCLCAIYQTPIRARPAEDALVLAAEQGWYEFVDVLLEMGANPDKRDTLEKSALLFCSEKGNTMCLKVLIDGGASLDIARGAKRSQHTTPLILAATNGHVVASELILRSERVDLEDRDSSGRTALSWACGEGHSSVVKILLKFKADIETTGDGKSSSGYTPLWYAISSKRSDVVRLLLQNGATANRKHPISGFTPLMGAVNQRDLRTCRAIFETCPDWSAEDGTADGKGWTALHHACENGDEDIVSLILEGRIGNGPYPSHQETPLMVAIEAKNLDIARFLLKEDYLTRLNLRDDSRAMELAKRNGFLDLAADLESTGEKERIDSGWSPASTSCQSSTASLKSLSATS